MILDNPYASGSLAVQNNLTASHGLYTGDLTVLGNINATVQGISATASYVEFSNIDGKPELLSGSAQIASDISGSFTELSSSLELRVANNEATGSDQESRLGTLEGKTLVSGSEQIASDISGSFTSLSSSLELRVTNNEATGSDQESRLGTLEGKTLVSSSLQIASDISGSFTDVSSSLTGRVVNLELTASNHEDRLLVYETSSVLSGSLQIADDISGSLGDNATLIRSLTAVGISGSLGANADLIRSLTAAEISGSLGANADLIRSLTAAGISGSLGDNATLIRSLTATGISGSLGVNADLIRSLTAVGISGSLGVNADLIRSLTAAEISGSLGANATLIRSLTAVGITGSFTSLSSSIASDINTKLNFADTGSFAKTDINNSFGGVQTFESINVNATASFGYIQSVTGSATYIGEEFVVVNASVDGARFGGIQVYDSESGLQHTASLAWDSLNNKWIYANASGSTYSGGGLISGPRNTGSLGEETYPTLNYVVRSQGGDHIYNSNIIDDNTTVKIGINTEVTGSLIVSSGITGALTGNASTATSASYATYAASAGSAGSATTATSASYSSNASTADSATAATSASYASAAPYSGLHGTIPTWNQDTTGNAATATSASYATFAASAGTAGSATTATSASHAGAAPYSGLYGTVPTWNQNTTGNAATATSASYATFATSAGSATDSTKLPLAGGTMTGALRFNESGYGRIAFTDNYHGFIVRGYPNNATGAITAGDVTALVEHSGDFRFYRTNGTINELYFQVNATAPYYQGNVIWHAGNDGTGSGLDADTVDGKDADSFMRTDADTSTTGTITIGGGLVIEGSAASGGTDYGYYENAGTNIILKGDSNGRSGIFFQSEKNGTNINHPSDFGFLQFHSYGYGGTTGEANALVLGVANDSTDIVVLQAPYNNGVKIGYKDATSGTGLTLGTVWHSANDGASSGLDADLLDGNHASAFALSGHTHGRIYAESGTTTNYLALSSTNELELFNSSGVVQDLYLNHSGGATSLKGPAGSTVWTSGNDGAGSGLDADNLDGVTWGNVNTDIIPSTNGTRNLGSSSYRWNTVYTSDLSMSNGIGDYTIVEGEEDLFLYNNKNGKVYKFLIQEVDPSAAPAKRE